MKQFLLYILLLMICSNIGHSQVVAINKSQLHDYKNIPQETIYVHFNSTLLFTGEYLYYTIYCLNVKTNYLSELSKIAYVELIAMDGDVIFKHKIKLEDGLGSGDFFIPVTIPSGSYKIIGYTKWMQNGTIDNFFQNDIHIINPYLADQSSVQTKENNRIDTINLATSTKENLSNNLKNEPVFSHFIDLIIKKQNFDTRSKVSMIIKGIDQNTITKNDFSISVRKRGTIPEPIKLNTVQYLKNYKSKEYMFGNSNGSKIYLPELRGELISGKVITKNNTISVKDLKVAVSISGENYYFGIAKTNKLGHFYLNIDKYYSGSEAILQVLMKKRQEFEVSLDKHISLDYSNISFTDLEIERSMEEEVLRRSIHNQIENAYFKYKPDSILSVLPNQLFENKKRLTYILDDFTRFKTVRETIFEIVKDVSIRRIEKDESVIRVQGYNFNSNTGILPLVLIDGMLIQNYDALLDYSARKIEKITIFRDQFVIGPQIYQGAIILKTINGIEDDLKNKAAVTTTTIFRPQESKNYFKQRHDKILVEGFKSRIPDDRIQLLWIPKLNQTEKQITIDFFTSDVTGEFEISIEGFSEKHKPVSIRKSIYVK